MARWARLLAAAVPAAPCLALQDHAVLSSLAAQTPAACVPEAVCLEFHDRLGNNLYQYERALWIAAQTNLCFVALPTPVEKNALNALVAQPEDGIVRLHAAAPNLTRAEVYERCSVSCLDCAPPRRAAAQHKPVCSEWGPCSLGKYKLEKPSIRGLRNVMQKSVVPEQVKCDPAASVPEGTIVMHLRSGDTLQGPKVRSGFYPQPPCAYFLAVMRRGNGSGPFERGLIVTEPDLRHPCIPLLQEAFPGRIEVQSRSVTEDACTVASARHLAISFGTWGPALSRLNRNLQDLYVPFGEDGTTTDEYGGSLARMSRHWFHQAIFEEGMPYRQHVYSFPGFRCEWQGQADHFAKMLRFQEGSVVSRTIPAVDDQA